MNLLMPFVDESENFVHGFECGQIWEKIEWRKNLVDYMFHTVNTKQVELMCQRAGYDFTIEEIGNGWSKLNAIVNWTKIN